MLLPPPRSTPTDTLCPYTTLFRSPRWLDANNPRVRVVTHQELYRAKDTLPTFNSSGIETQLHHIGGLAEHFLYFNDDFFLGDFCVPEDFFFANGAMKIGRAHV